MYQEFLKLDERLKNFILAKRDEILKGPHLCFGFYYFPHAPYDPQLPVQLAEKDIAALQFQLAQLCPGTTLVPSVMTFDVSLQGVSYKVVALFVFNEPPVQVLINRHQVKADTLHLISNHLKDTFTGKSTFFIFSLDSVAVQRAAQSLKAMPPRTIRI